MALQGLLAGAEQQQPSFSTASGLVVVPAVVVDRKGQIVRGLDVEAYLRGYLAPINDHRLHKIDVKVSAPNTTVRARRARG